MWNAPTEKQLAKLPALYATENTPLAEKKIYMHFFIGGCDWWVAEYDPQERLFFGFANLNDPQNAEWGYVSLDELKALKVQRFMEVDRDMHWTVRPAKEVAGIRC